MSALLPDTPPASMSVRLISSKNQLTPAFGDGEQELVRKGSRYEITFDMGEMDYVEALDWTDLMSEGQTVVMAVSQPGLDIGAPGAPRVNGAGQSGTSLALDGLTAAYGVRKGQFLSVVTAGRRFLYRAREAAVANGGGQLIVPIQTMLRYPPSDNDTVEILQPMIEGFPRDVSDLSVADGNTVEVSFTVRER